MTSRSNEQPRIVVLSPQAGESVRDRVRVAGLSDTFEANVVIVARDTNGVVLARAHTQGGCMVMAPFEIELSLSARPTAQDGWIEVYEEDPRRGEVQKVTVPVHFLQAYR